MGDHKAHFSKLENDFNKRRIELEDELVLTLEDKTTFDAKDYKPQASHTSVMQKAMKTLMSEIWGAIIPTSCPNCQAKSPGFRKDGFTKIFQRALSEKLKTQIQQQDRISKNNR